MPASRWRQPHTHKDLMIVGVPTEKFPGERRVALVPELVPKLTKAGLEVLVQSGGGAAAGFSDRSYLERAARLEPEIFQRADILLKVQPPTADEIGRMKEGSTLIGFLQPYTNTAEMRTLAARRGTAFSMELMPRLTRAQPMDALV